MYIVDFQPVVPDVIDALLLSKIERKISNGESLSKQEASYFLDSVIYITRIKVSKDLFQFDYKCDLAQSILYYYFSNLGCPARPSATQNVITNNIVGHSFLTVSLIVEGKEVFYLLDPTYIQFFKQENCRFEKYYVSPQYPDTVLLTPDPGYFIKSDDWKDVQEFLNHGYMILDEKHAGMYGNSFYNTKTGGSFQNRGYQTIPGNVYVNAFLKGNEPLSKTERELEQLDLSIPLFQEMVSVPKIK